ncbi:hypothetical protein ElyMa_006080600 [Elysia marginata]|uniref:Uncharacterized protein n=1 Tax=Elysia marginata TaxID=1093978 RepID=A0AAV4GRT5_9GAST|nr:hypothetical protein ElyMa_006080600 [Elysia marginata]
MAFRDTCTSVFLVLCVSFSFERAHGYGSDLREVKEQLEILTNEVSRLADASSPSKDHEVHATDPVTVLSVERVPGPSANIFTVNFTKNVPEIYYDITAYDSTIGSSAIRLRVDRSDHQPMSQDEFTVPMLEVKHEGDLVYDSGKDVKVKVSASYGSERTSRFSDVRASFKVITQDGLNFGERPGDGWTEKSTKKFLDSEETTFTIETSKHPVSGFLVLSSSFTDTEATLVSKVVVSRTITTRHIAVRLILGYYRKIEWTVQQQFDSVDTTFQCIALTAVSNITRDIVVEVASREFYIDANRTGMEVEVNEVGLKSGSQ